MTRIPVEHKLELVIDKAVSLESRPKPGSAPVRAYISILESAYGEAATAFLTLNQLLELSRAINRILEGD